MADELKAARRHREADRHHAVDLVATCLGGHDVPPEFEGRASEWVEVVAKALARCCSKATFADVFTESHVFGIDDSRRLMESARDAGLELRMHVDQRRPSAAPGWRPSWARAAAADHLEHVTPEGIRALAERGVQPVLCPLVPLYLGGVTGSACAGDGRRDWPRARALDGLQPGLVLKRK